MLILSRSDLQRLTDIDATRTALRDVLSRQGQDAYTVTPNVLRLEGDDAAYIPMLGADLRSNLVTSKTLTDRPSNARNGRPSQVSAITVIDRESGFIKAILHGEIPTRIRTAGVSAVATDALAKENASRLGLVGAGALAIEHARAIQRVRPLEIITVWSRTKASVDNFRSTLESLWDGVVPTITVASSPEEVVRESDIVCTLTPSVTPIVRGAWLSTGHHLNVVGARPRPTDREVDAEAFRRSRVYIDHYETVTHESGDYLLATADDGSLPEIVAELSSVLRGEAPGRLDDQEITLYNSVGTGLQDTAIVDVILRAAIAANIGTEVALDA
ncbi:ornithine cyclodeaminase family protein [Arthrobacter sp. E3]|uniref:ornithine cyclodeaminase family protein n=1 Tax=Arthrobacter sp. E3 TaxID=517402 RepID=UPI001A944650|nr:ornithine cyclodeaminase family protein [Arthrobacter sp. E3]